MKPKLVDLFSGAGGMSLGFREAGYEPVFAADWDVHACRTYAANFGEHVHLMDLGKMEPVQLAKRIVHECGPIDVVAGGAPCQGFSIQRRGEAVDARNDLAIRFAEIAASISPKAIVLENVPTILGPRGREYVTKIFHIWKNAGYEVHASVLGAAEYGVPQLRRRAFIVGVRRDVGTKFVFPKPQVTPSRYKTVRNAIGDMPSPPSDFTEHPEFRNHVRVALSERNLERFSYVPEGGGRLDVPRHLQLPCHLNSNGHRHLDVFGRMWWDRPSGTITAMFDNFTRGRFGHPSENRNITNREGARLQSFPDDFVFWGPKKDVARQIGNAVAPLMARAIAEALLQVFVERTLTPQKSFQRTFAIG